MQVVPTSNYERRAKKLLSASDRSAIELELVAGWDGWPVIPGTGGARKARIPVGNRGKRGGGRVIYFVPTAQGTLYLLDIYAKGQKEDLTNADKQAIRSFIESIEQETGED